jgi:hypothetical protein
MRTPDKLDYWMDRVRKDPTPEEVIQQRIEEYVESLNFRKPYQRPPQLSPEERLRRRAFTVIQLLGGQDGND